MGTASSVEIAKPSRYRSRRRRLRSSGTPSRRRDIGSNIGSLWALQHAAEAALLQEFAARLAGAELCFRPGERAAALARIVRERDSALRALRDKHRSERRQHQVATKPERAHAQATARPHQLG